MKHSVLSCMLFLIVLAVIGCTKSPTTQPKAPPATDGGGKKSVAADTTKQLPGCECNTNGKHRGVCHAMAGDTTIAGRSNTVDNDNTRHG